MALDRQSIEKKDFPIGRRGYDTEAVDAHLRALADEIEELKRSERRRSESLASAASDQVRSIVEAAEAAAAEIQRQAEDDARGYVSRVGESTTGMLERIEAMENELGTLIESLRAGSNRLSADLQLLERSLASVKDAVVPRPGGAAARAAGAGEAAGAAGAGTGGTVVDAVRDPSPALRPDGTEDESARLVALNMVMNDTPREEIERYLAEHFRLVDRRGLLDAVYSSLQN